MVKKISLSILTAALLSTGASAADDLASAFKDGKINGQIRAFYIDREYAQIPTLGTTKPPVSRSAFALGGKMGFDTASYYGLSLGMEGYTSNGLGMKNGDITKVDPTLFGTGANKPDVTYLGQAYAVYQAGNTTFKFGRQQLDTPLAGSDDARMLPTLFEAYLLINKDIPFTTLIAGQVTRVAAGTFANGYGKTGAAQFLGLQSGYGLGYDTGKFVTMKDQALGALDTTHNTAGVTAVAAVYTGFKDTTIQVWDYYAWDILNAFYLQADTKTKVGDMEVYGALQFVKEDDVGDNLAGKAAGNVGIGSQMWGIKAGFKPLSYLNLYAAFNQSGKDSNKLLNGGIITPWGGTPSFAQGIVTRLADVADTNAYKVGALYDIMPGLTTHLHYTKFNVGKSALYYVVNKVPVTHDAGETDFEVIYKPAQVKNLELKVRCIYARDFVPSQDYNEYRVIANYNF